MLSICHMSLGSEQYYLTLAAEDYYLQGGEPPGRWIGSGASAMGLVGEVDAKALKELFNGYDPEGKALVRNAGVTTGKLRRKPGWDLTFSAPKSVSLIWSQLDRHGRRKIEAAHQAAVERAIAFIEQQAALSRRGKGGVERVEAKLAVAAFQHGTSRALDPQLHTHCLLLNLGVCADGRVRSLVSKPVYQNKMLAGAIYRLELAQQLSHTLGLRPQRKKSCFEIIGVPQKTIERFSKRRQAIEAKLGELGIDTASAAAFATLKTRQVKDLVPPRQELFERWRQEAREAGFCQMTVRGLLGRHRAAARPQQAVRQEVQKAVKCLAANRSYMTTKDLLLETAHQLQGSGVSPDDLLRLFETEVDRTPGICNLGIRNGRRYLATEQELVRERKLLKTLAGLTQRSVAAVPESLVDDLLARPACAPKIGDARRPLALSREQKEAVRHLVLGSDAVKVVTGLAGTGKTSMLAVARHAFELAGYRVVGAAPTHRARQELSQGAGIDADTIRKRLLEIYPERKFLAKHHARQLVRAARKRRTYSPDLLRLLHKTVLVVDEASMVQTEDMQQLLAAVQQQGGRILLVGDDRQLPPVGPGGAFGAIIRRVGSKDLAQVTRQKDAWGQRATGSIAAGDVERFLRAYAGKGFLTTAPAGGELEQSLLKDWKSAGGALQPESHVIAASTNEQVDKYNRAAQQIRMAEGLLDARRALEVGPETFYVGDRITFQKNSRKLGVFNGDSGTVLYVKDWGFTKAIAVKLDLPERSTGTVAKEVVLHTARQLLRAARKRKTYRYDPNSYDVRIIPISNYLGQHKYIAGDGPGDRAPLRLAYAFTTHKLQGATIDHTYVALGDSMTDREMAYVQGSRHRNSLRLYATEYAAGEKLTQLAKAGQSPGDAELPRERAASPLDSPLVKEMQRSRKRSLAYDLYHDPLPADEWRPEH